MIECVKHVADECSKKMNQQTRTLGTLADGVIMLHMVQENITKDMSKVNLISNRTEHDLILKDRQPTLCKDNPGKKLTATNL